MAISFTSNFLPRYLMSRDGKPVRDDCDRVPLYKLNASFDIFSYLIFFTWLDNIDSFLKKPIALTHSSQVHFLMVI